MLKPLRLLASFARRALGLDLLLTQVEAIDQRLSSTRAMIGEHLDRTESLRRELVMMSLHTRLVLHEARGEEASTRGASQRETVPPPLTFSTLDETFAMLQRRHPRLYPIWRSLMEAGEDAYRTAPSENLSLFGNPNSVAFRAFCLPSLKGTVLDVGCGPMSIPSYLVGYDTSQIAAIDPFGSADVHPFLFVNATAESIPWAEASFDRVVIGTSLDHLLDLDLGLSEIARVLRPDGQVIQWVGLIPGAPKYDPLSPGAKNVDEYHLFQFDRPWFLELMARYFSCLEEVNFDGISHFYRFRKNRTHY
jgi:SAM-dependent methyltransferase